MRSMNRPGIGDCSFPREDGAMPEKSKAGRGPYPPEVRERAVRMVFDHRSEHPSQWKAIESIVSKLAINHETLRQWVRRAETDTGERPRLTTDERAWTGC